MNLRKTRKNYATIHYYDVTTWLYLHFISTDRHLISFHVFNMIVNDAAPWFQDCGTVLLPPTLDYSILAVLIQRSNTKKKFFSTFLELFFLLGCLMTSFLTSTGRSLDCLLYEPSLMPQFLFSGAFW